MKKAIVATIALAAMVAVPGIASAKYKLFTITMAGYCNVFTVKQYTRTFITVAEDPSSCESALGIGEIGNTNFSGSVATAGVVLNGDAANPLYMEMKFPLRGGVIHFFKIGANGDPEQTMATVYAAQRTRLRHPHSGTPLSSLLKR